MITVIQAHPYPDHSRANRILARALDGLAGVQVRSLYNLYPDFSIDVAAEQRVLEASSTVVWQHPLYWYSAPALLKLWFEKVLTPGWAYGQGGTALRGKRCLWVITTGGHERDYSDAGMHQHEIDAFVPVIRQTARFCGLSWLDPLIVHDALRASIEQLETCGARYRARVAALAAEDDAPRA